MLSAVMTEMLCCLHEDCKRNFLNFTELYFINIPKFKKYHQNDDLDANNTEIEIGITKLKMRKSKSNGEID